MEEENTPCDDDLHHDQIGILLPQDVFIHILVFLPVISLLRFKYVCKSWRALIQSSLFISLHLNTTNNNNNFGTFIFQTSDYYLPSKKDRRSEAFMLSAAGGDDNDEFEKLLKLEDLGFPPRYKFSPDTHHDHIFMVGSCNGLICIHETKLMEVCLWNPATRQFRILPKSLTTIPKQFKRLPTDFAAFGYDVKTNDYKVVVISYYKPDKEYIFRVQIYSLSTDSWRLLEGINYLPALPRQTNHWNHGVYLKNGSYYFLGTYFIDSKPTLMLFSFDFTKEIFTTIQLPHDYHHLTTILTSLAEKQLAVFARRPANEDESDFVTHDVWVLNEHHHGGGVKEELWTKLHSIRLNGIGDYTAAGGTPRSISNNGEFAIIYTEGYRVINSVHVSNRQWLQRLQLFNLVTNEVEKEFPTDTVIRAEVYKQSLVSIGGEVYKQSLVSIDGNHVQQPIG